MSGQLIVCHRIVVDLVLDRDRVEVFFGQVFVDLARRTHQVGLDVVDRSSLPDFLQQVDKHLLENVIRNAVKYTAEGTEVNVGLMLQEKQRS